MLERIAKWMALAAFLLVGLAAGAQQAKWAPPSDQTAQSLISMERQWAQADCDGNLAIETILADDFQGTAPDGTRYTKTLEIQRTKTSKHEDHGCELGEVRVHFFGDSLAVLYGTESRFSKERDGVERSRTLIWTDTWLKRGGRWQIIAAQDNWATPK